MYAGKVVKNKNWSCGEVQNLKACRHPNIVMFYDVDICPKTRDVLLVTEFLNSTLYDGLRPTEESLYSWRLKGKGVQVLRGKFHPPLNAIELAEIVSGCFNGLSYLHEKEIMHRDISSSNILLSVGTATVDGNRHIMAKIADFGLAKLFDADNEPTTRLLNAFYSAPEASGFQTQTSYDGFAADTYSFGVVITESLMSVCGQWSVIERQYNGRESFASVCDVCFATLQDSLPRFESSFVRAMVHADPRCRPLIDSGLANKWHEKYAVEGVNEDNMLNNLSIEEPSAAVVALYAQLRPALPKSTDAEVWELCKKNC